VKQAVARLDQLRTVVSRVASQAVHQAEIRLAQAESRLRRLEATPDSSTEADREDARRAVEQARSQYDTATAQALAAAEGGAEARLALAALEQARAAHRAAEARLEQTRIRAPADGVVLERRVEPGEVVQPARTLLVVARDGPTRLSVLPDERSLALLALGQPATVVADAFPGRPFQAEVSYIAPAVDPSRGTVEVRLAVARSPDFLRTDMTVSVNIDVVRHRDALVLPTDAVRDAAVRPWVLAVKGGRTQRLEVALGARGDDLVQILGGLSEGDAVVPPAAARVGPGERVRPVPADPPRARHVL
jgi:HlyD family secretion protein